MEMNCCRASNKEKKGNYYGTLCNDDRLGGGICRLTMDRGGDLRDGSNVVYAWSYNRACFVAV